LKRFTGCLPGNETRLARNVARTRTTKKLAQRIDLNYFKRPSAFKSWRLWLCVVLPVLAVVWIAWHGFAKDNRVYSSGRMSFSHAVLEKECATCHIQQNGSFSLMAADSTCLACHDGPVHHGNQVKTLECASCHTEHRGRINISAVNNQTCAECHSDLKTNKGMLQFQAHINSFQDGHPQFAALRDSPRDPGTIKLNHQLHMKPVRRSPNNPATVQLACGDCHRGAGVQAQWNYADPKYVAAKVTYSAEGELLPVKGDILPSRKAMTGRELMAPVKYATACASCHELKFSANIDDGAPHDKPEVVHFFVMKKFQDYIAAHPAELREVRDPGRDLAGKQNPPRLQVLTPAQWVAQQTAVAEELLWKKCTLCHTLNNLSLQDPSIGRWSAASSQTQMQNAGVQAGSVMALNFLPQVAASNTTARWMPHSKFDHDAHRGFTCESCHEKALTSKDSFDVLLPGIATCQKCHAPGPEHAESRCFECHTYHDWARRKEVTPKFTLPSLRTGGD
jgi:hypothetical protein